MALNGSSAGSPGGWFRSGEVVRILGISHRQLQHWADTDLVPASARTKGGHRRYAFQDLVALRATKRLLDAGVSIRRIHHSIRTLRRTVPGVSQPLVELVLVAAGEVVLVLRDGSAFEAITGQEWVLPVSELQREIDAWAGRSGRAPGRTRSVRRPA